MTRFLWAGNHRNTQQTPPYLVIFRPFFGAAPVSPELPARGWHMQPPSSRRARKCCGLGQKWNQLGVRAWFSFSYPLLAWYSSQSSSWVFPTDFSERRMLIAQHSHYFKKPHKSKTPKHHKTGKRRTSHSLNAETLHSQKHFKKAGHSESYHLQWKS